MRVLVIKADLLSADAAAIPPLGSLHIADVARRLGADAEVIDLRLVSPPRIGETVRRALANRPDVVGLSALPQDHRFVKRLAAYVRALGGPELFLVGGGPYFASCADDALRHTPIDAAVLGEGERTFEQLLRHWQGGTSWREVRGIAYRNNGSTVENPPQELLTTAELDALHPLGWDLIDLREYARFASYSGRSGTVYAPMLTSRGCPFRCINCYHMLGFPFRGRSPENVVAEVDHLVRRHGIRRLEVLDESFNFDYDRALAILEGIARLGTGIALECPRGLRADFVDARMVRALKDAGCTLLSLPIESASPRLQGVLKKRANVPKTIEALRLAKEAGLYTWGFFMVGVPSETREEADETFRMARTAGFDMPIVFIATPNPGTDFAAMVHAPTDPATLNFYYGKYNYFSDVPAAYLHRRRMRILTLGLLRRRNWFMLAGYYRAFYHGIRRLGVARYAGYLARYIRPRRAFLEAVRAEASASIPPVATADEPAAR